MYIVESVNRKSCRAVEAEASEPTDAHPASSFSLGSHSRSAGWARSSSTIDAAWEGTHVCKEWRENWIKENEISLQIEIAYKANLLGRLPLLNDGVSVVLLAAGRNNYEKGYFIGLRRWIQILEGIHCIFDL